MKTQEKRMNEKGYIRAPEAARLVGVSITTIYTWITEGAVEEVRIGAAHYVSRASLIKKLGPTASLLLGLTGGKEKTS